ncbi:hypothetical protein LTR56_001373 [Elasticomyces elasticus]|nr:hypothetical protein LTR56_001373 [Elasticomyces elasticus]KAK3667554.1 hypothetical protein LTR22_001732 [Elasticomyces elasticus]KAK4927965.1 hypothetical protein LTR49_005164 [Elasticomyces elasticus]KAK5762402.1 hypothetical protein LTS12_007379 [Elasticomyces elasticus]
MYAASALATLALGAVSVAAYGEQPTSSWKGSNGATVVSYLTKFDNVEAGLIGSLPVRPISPLGPYNSLSFNLNALNVGQGLAGVKPQSAPNVVSFDATFQPLEGEPSFTSDFDDSIVDSFNFKSFYFGCVLTNVETAASLTDDCSIHITGYRNGKEVASQDGTFDDGSLLPSASAAMDKVTLNSGFKNVDKVTFAINGVLDSTLDAALLDNFSYDVTLKKGYSSITA